MASIADLELALLQRITGMTGSLDDLRAAYYGGGGSGGGSGSGVDQTARDSATAANTAAGNAQTAANNAQTTATRALLGEKSTLTEGIDMGGTVDQTAKIQAALNSLTPGQVFRLTPNPGGGNSVIALSSTITVPAGVTIAGPDGAASIWGYSSGYPVQFKTLTGFTGTSVFKVDAGTGTTSDFAFQNFAVLGNHVGTNIHGFQFIGTVINAQMEHIDIRDMSGNGVSIESNTTGTPKGFRMFRVMSESHTGWSFYIDGLTDSDILECQAHTSTLGGWYLAGLGDSRFTDLRATFVGGPGYYTADCSRAGRPWGSGVQLNNIGTDRSQGPGLYHTAHNLNPITIGTATFGRDQSLGGGSTVPNDANAAIKIDGGSGTPAGVIAFGELTTTVGYDDTGQDDTYSSPGHSFDVQNSRGFSVSGGVLWGKLDQIKTMTDTVAATVGPITIDPSVWYATGTRSNLSYVGPRGVPLNLRTTSASTVGVNTAGNRVFIVPQGMDFAPGLVVRAESQANPTTVYVEGPVASYSGTTLSINPTTRTGTGSPSAWNIYASALGAAIGATGGTTNNYYGTPVVTYASGAWPTRASVIPSGYTGAVIYDSSATSGAPAPTDSVNGDTWYNNTGLVTLTGTVGQVPYISGTNALSGAANALIENGYLRVPNSTPSVKPASNGAVLTGANVGNRQVLASYDPQGRLSVLQNDLGLKSTALAVPNGGTTLSQVGTAVTTVPAAGVNGTQATTNIATTAKRLLLEAASAATAVAGMYETVAKVLPSTTAFGGAQVTFRFVLTKGTASTTRRFFVGLSSSVAAVADSEPSTAWPNLVGFGFDAADTNLSFMWKGATGTATKVSTGIAKTSIADGTEIYEVTLTSEPNAYFWAGYLRTLSTGVSQYFDTSSGGTTPDQSTLLAARMYMSAGGTATPVGVAVVTYKQETDY